ncbi:MAG: flagellar basal body-associated FliL family protein [Caldicoprobacterales bacterium]|nr:flagellar basal body-associated FliL family protein [Clostridiales bacterium]
MRRIAIIAIIILLVLAVGIGSAIIYILVSPNLDKKNNDESYVYSTGESFLTNIKDGSHYVKADILIEVSNKKSLKILEQNNHKIRDQIIEILGNIDEEEIKNEDFKKNLRNTLKEDLQKLLNIDKIEGIYFNEFIIQ